MDGTVGPDPGPSHYEVLGITPGASTDEVRRAFRRAAKDHHPDVGGDPEGFHRLQHAHDVLTDPLRRRDHDRALAARSPAGAGTTPERSGPNPDEGFSGDVSFPSWLRPTTDAAWEGSDQEGTDDGTRAVETLHFEVAWRWPGPTTGRPAIDDGGGVLVPSGDSVVRIDGSTGAVTWRAPLATEVAVPPLPAAGTDVVWTADGDVHGLDPARGTTRWQHHLGLPAAPAALAGDLVLLPQAPHHLDALVHTTGRRAWSAHLAGIPVSVIAAGGGAAVAVTEDAIESIDLRRGRHRWRHRLPTSTDFPPVSLGGSLLLGEAGGTLWRVEPRTGAISSGWDVGSAMAGMTSDGSRLLVTTAGPPELVALTVGGRVLWSWRTEEVDPEPAVVGRHGYLMGHSGHLVVVDLVAGLAVGIGDTGLDPYGPPLALAQPRRSPLIVVRGVDGALTALVPPRTVSAARS